MKRYLASLTIVIFILGVLCAPRVSGQPAATRAEVGQIVKLLQSGLGEEVVIEKLKKDGKSYDLSTEDLIELKRAGASNTILKTMMNPGGAAVASASAAVSKSEFPDEQGVYLKVKGEWLAIDPEVVNMRTANMIGHALSYGISKGKIKGDISGTKAKMQATNPIEILIRSAEGVAASEYQVLRVEQKENRREFEAMQMGFASAKSGARKGIIEVKFEKVGRSTYRGSLGNEEPGEFGILPPGAVSSASTASAGKVYAFGIIE